MKETKHYCDRCNKEIKYFFQKPCFIPITVNQNTYDDIVKGDEISVLLHSKNTKYELCGKCYKEFKNFIKMR